jgi:hypothetical protein
MWMYVNLIGWRFHGASLVLKACRKVGDSVVHFRCLRLVLKVSVGLLNSHQRIDVMIFST